MPEENPPKQPEKIENKGKSERIVEAEISDEMQKAYIDYAMSVIVSRALPSVEDGLKPVHRRILYSMYLMGLHPEKQTRKSARIVGNCFVKDTQILTTKGLLPIEKVERGDFVYTHRGVREVTELYEMPEKELINVTLNNGTSVIGTYDQRFKILDKDLKYKWKKAKDLKEDDFVVIKADYPDFKENIKLRLFNNKYLELNENIAYLLGQFLSDGHIEKKTNRIGFCSSSDGVINRIKFILEKEFGYVANIEIRNKNYQTNSGQLIQSRLYAIRINNRILCNYLASTFNLVGKNAYTKEIPYQILLSPKKAIYAFLSGLIDGDGSIHKSRNVINYASISEKLIDKLLLITQQLGILGRKSVLKESFHVFNERIVESTYPCYHIEYKGEFARKLASNLNLSEEKKKERILILLSKRIGKSNFEIIPFMGNAVFSELSNKHLGAGWYGDCDGKKFRLGIKYPGGCKIRYSKNLKEKELRKSQIIEWKILNKLEKIDSKYYKLLKDIFDNKIFFLKIKRIGKSEAEKTYDFKVKNDHELIANGIVSHNCMGQFHPHGDIAIYDALVRMAQDFSLRYPLIYGQGNWGGIDGDPPAAMRYCITGNSLIITEKGLERIDEVSNKEDMKLRILSKDKKVHNASKWFDSGEHETIKIITNKGYTLTGSKNHPILTITKDTFGKPVFMWKLLENIKEGDIAVIDRREDNFWPEKGIELEKYYPKIRNKKQKIRILPTTLDRNLGFLLGLLVSEGTISYNKLEFTNSDEKLIKEFEEKWNKVFPDSVLHKFKRKPSSYGKKEYFRLECHCRYTLEFLRNIGLEFVKSHKKTIPFLIFKSPKEIVTSFLRAYFEGGGGISYSTKMVELTCCSKSEKLIRELQILLLRLGIESARRYDKYKFIDKLFIRGKRNLLRFYKEINFVCEGKKKKLEFVLLNYKKEASLTDYVPFISNFVRSLSHNEFIIKNNFDRCWNMEKNYQKVTSILMKKTGRDYSSIFEYFLTYNYLFEPIVKIENVGVQKVYSIKVDSNCHSFISNGFISHNTEAKLAKISKELLQDLDKDTVPWLPNFDNSTKEPVMLPGKLPNLLINGSSGIAVGMMTNIPPHNLIEVCDATIKYIDKPDITIEKLTSIVQGPDFPTGGYVVSENLLQLYKTGRASLTLRGKLTTEITKSKQRIVITEIPYMVNKATLVLEIANLAKSKKLPDVSDLRDESAKGKVRVVIELRKGANPKFTINRLYKYTKLQTRFDAVLIALVKGQPRLLTLKDIVKEYVDYRKLIIRKRIQYELKKAEERLHIVQGLLIALRNLDKVIETIRKSKNATEALSALQSRFKLSQKQAQAILETRLQQLTALEREKLAREEKELERKIKELKKILASEKEILAIIKKELAELKRNYGDARRTQILQRVKEFKEKDLIAKKDVIVTITDKGYIKRILPRVYHEQKRGGKGVIGTELASGDFVRQLICCSTHDYLLLFTNKGRVYWLKAYQVPETTRYGKGQALINLLNLKEDFVTSVIAVKKFENYLFMATKKGQVKKIALENFSKPRSTGVKAIKLPLDNSDALIDVNYIVKGQEVMLNTALGQAIRFNSDEVREMGRASYGVTGIKLNKEDKVVSLEILPDKEKLDILTITEKGYGKRTEAEDYRLTGRACKGVINLKVTDKTGGVVTTASVKSKDNIIVTTAKGIVIRTNVKQIRVMGRATQGVRIIKLQTGDKVTDLVKLQKHAIEEVEESGEEGKK